MAIDSVEWLRMMRDHSGLLDCQPHFDRIADELEQLRAAKMFDASADADSRSLAASTQSPTTSPQQDDEVKP